MKNWRWAAHSYDSLEDGTSERANITHPSFDYRTAENLQGNCLVAWDCSGALTAHLICDRAVRLRPGECQFATRRWPQPDAPAKHPPAKPPMTRAREPGISSYRWNIFQSEETSSETN